MSFKISSAWGYGKASCSSDYTKQTYNVPVITAVQILKSVISKKEKCQSSQI